MKRAVLLALWCVWAIGGEAERRTADLVATIGGEAIHVNELTIGPLLLNDVSARPTLKDEVLTFNDCQAAFYGGEVRGTLALDLRQGRTRLAVTVQGVDLAALLAGLGATSDGYSGRLDGRLELAFPTEDVLQAEGRAQASIRDGNLVEMSFLANLLVGNIGNVRGQDQADLTAEIRAGHVHLSSAQVTIPKGIVLISGTVALDGGLRLLVVPRVAGGVLSQVWLVGKWFGAALALASSRVARVVVRGTLARPVIVLNPFAND